MFIKNLGDFGISHVIVEKLLVQGYHELTEVQKLAIQLGLFSGNSLVVNSPTGTGKYHGKIEVD